MYADSIVLAYVMKTLNDRYKYGLDLFLLSIDEGITGYRDDSLEVLVFKSLVRAQLLMQPLDGQAKPTAVRHAP